MGDAQEGTSASQLSFPFSLDGYSNQSASSDTMKSLLNAIIVNAPPTTSVAAGAPAVPASTDTDSMNSLFSAIRKADQYVGNTDSNTLLSDSLASEFSSILQMLD